MSSALEALQANLRAELSRQETLFRAITEEKDAVLRRDQSGLERALSELTRLASEGATLEIERQALFPQIAGALGLEGRRINLGEIVRGAGAGRPELGRLHVELREASRKVAVLNRRIGQLVRHSREVYTAALETVLAAAGIGDARAGGKQPASGLVLNAEG